MRKSVYEWAVEYCGDPASHTKRGEVILDFLRKEGLKPHHRVLDVGCGALSQGKELIEYLGSGNYVGLDPNGWLIEAALNEFPQLQTKDPLFSYNSEFLTSHGPYDYVVAHSVLSHVAEWQMEMAIQNLRSQVNIGAIWLASVRLAEEDTVARNWVYPGVSFFRMGTIIKASAHAGWSVEERPRYREGLEAKCPNDFHDWIAFYAVRPPHEIGEISRQDEARKEEDDEIMQIAMDEYRRRHAETD
jgi:cyclopropane fatty-acyl-phospholipid synthase-like methyltransferase